jgi:uncharacterized protein GlcG (DUF336 family)
MMFKSAVTVIATLSVVSVASAQTVTERATTPPHGGPPLTLALEAVQTAEATCHAKGYNVTALIVDYHGALIALLSGDGASYMTPDFAAYKAATVMKFRVASRVVSDRADHDPALVAELKADPKINAAHIGGLPIMAGGEMIGAIAVSGAPGGENDEACDKAGLGKIASRLH